MKKTVASLFTAGLLACSAGLALADGIPTAANIAEAPIGGNEWRGFFVSASVGYGWSDSSLSIGPISADYEADGFQGAVGLGYDIMARDNIVFGVFTDYTFGDEEDKFLMAAIDTKSKIDDIWAIGARAGVIVHKDLLLFGTVGYTSAQQHFSNTLGDKDKDHLDGYFVGVGLERLLCSNLYLKGEYRYSDFGDDTETVAAPCVSCEDKTENENHSIRVGLAYKFGARQEEAVPLK